MAQCAFASSQARNKWHWQAGHETCLSALPPAARCCRLRPQRRPGTSSSRHTYRGNSSGYGRIPGMANPAPQAIDVRGIPQGERRKYASASMPTRRRPSHIGHIHAAHRTASLLPVSSIGPNRRLARCDPVSECKPSRRRADAPGPCCHCSLHIRSSRRRLPASVRAPNPPLPRVPTRRPHRSQLRLARAGQRLPATGRAHRRSRPPPSAPEPAAPARSTAAQASFPVNDRRPRPPATPPRAPTSRSLPILAASWAPAEPHLDRVRGRGPLGHTRIASTPAQGPSLVRNAQWHLRALIAARCLLPVLFQTLSNR